MLSMNMLPTDATIRHFKRSRRVKYCQHIITKTKHSYDIFYRFYKLW